MTALRRSVLVAVIAGLLGTTVPAAAARPEGDPLRAQADRLAAVQVVLDQRAEAVIEGDQAGFLATVDPEAPDAFDEAQLRSYTGLRSVPLASYSLEARLTDTGDLAPGIAAAYGGAVVFLPETRQRMRLRDYDDRDAVDSLWLTFVQRGGRWYVAADDDLSPVGIDSFKGLWDQGPVVTRATPHFLVLSHPGDAARAEALATIAEEAAATLDARWDQAWSKKIPLILPGDTDELEILLQSTVDLDKFVAFVSYGAVVDEAWQATAPRMYIQDQNLGGYSRAFQVETIVHELVHAAAAPIAGPFVPNWVHEGIAEWEAHGRQSTRAAPSGSGLPRDHQFATGPSTSILAAYASSESAVTALAARSGVGAPTAFLAELGSRKVAPGNADHHTDQALRTVTGLGVGEFEGFWRQL